MAKFKINNLDPEEIKVIYNFKSTQQGKCGTIQVGAERDHRIVKTYKKLLKKGVLVERESFKISMSVAMLDEPFIGLAGVEYPTTGVEAMDYIVSGYVHNRSFKKFKQDFDKGLVLWTSKEVNKALNHDFQDLVETKFKSEVPWMAYLGGGDGFTTATALVRDDVDFESILEELVVEYFKYSVFVEYGVTVIDTDWFNSVMADKIDEDYIILKEHIDNF